MTNNELYDHLVQLFNGIKGNQKYVTCVVDDDEGDFHFYFFPKFALAEQLPLNMVFKRVRYCKEKQNNMLVLRKAEC